MPDRKQNGKIAGAVVSGVMAWTLVEFVAAPSAAAPLMTQAEAPALMVAMADAASLKKRHHEEWSAMIAAQKAEIDGAPEAEKATLSEKHKAARRAMKARHKREWQDLNQPQG